VTRVVAIGTRTSPDRYASSTSADVHLAAARVVLAVEQIHGAVDPLALWHRDEVLEELARHLNDLHDACRQFRDADMVGSV